MDQAITALVTRLEQVTKRLEDIEKKLEAAPASGAAASGSASEGPSAEFVQEYQDLVAQFIKPFVEQSRTIANQNGDKALDKQAELVQQAVDAQLAFLKIAAASKQPSDSVLQQLLTPTNQLIQEIVKVRDSNRASKLFNHLSAISEGIAALGWVVVSPTPGPYVADMRAGSEFYSNRVLKDYKGKEQIHVDWVNNFNGFLKELQAYIKKHHTTGLKWNPKGGDASASVAAAPAPPSGAAPPPPGPPPPVPDLNTPSSSSSKKPDMSGLFAEINRGTDVTAGLRKVTADMKTKNRTDKTSVVPASTGSAKQAAPKKAAAAPSRPPKLALEGNKWVVEFQQDNRNIVINQTEAKQTVYIYKCNNSLIQIQGKVNAITCDDCTKTSVVFENAVSSFEVVNCRSLEMQVTGKVPSIAVDKTSGCQIYLSKDSLDAEIVTSKSSEMNVLIPGPSDDSDMVEMPIPEQYKTTVKGGKLVTEIVQHV